MPMNSSFIRVSERNKYKFDPTLPAYGYCPSCGEVVDVREVFWVKDNILAYCERCKKHVEPEYFIDRNLLEQETEGGDVVDELLIVSEELEEKIVRLFRLYDRVKYLEAKLKKLTK